VHAWNRPLLPRLPGDGVLPLLFDTVSQALVEARPDPAHPGVASIYVCGITPYDATHLGHASTYLAFDSLIRLWIDAGFEVRYVQNVTDVDDPLLERAARDGVDWRQLAAEQVQLFRSDMERLRIVPPDEYVGVTEVVPAVGDAVGRLESSGAAYRVESADAEPDLYFDSTLSLPAWSLGDESRLDAATMLALSAERGGDPDRAGKRHPLDPLLWRSERPGEPAWESAVGRGRPGWHIECSVIALEHLPMPLTVNGGGSDLIFPHHEFSAGHAAALTGHALSAIYSHSGMVAYQGEKMSKSLGNLVLVSRLAAAGVDPRAIRLALLSEHYRSDWEWFDSHLDAARERLDSWRAWAGGASLCSLSSGTPSSDHSDSAFVDGLRSILANDLDTPGALAAIDSRIVDGPPATPLLIDAIDALLGISLVD
jgi:L-cysteine:1D-myo-inositol 2-amino-2-deoxy-alpha-D-glucopyranoside ligase